MTSVIPYCRRCQEAVTVEPADRCCPRCGEALPRASEADTVQVDGTPAAFAGGPGVLPAGEELGHFRICRLLGAGGMARVYLATHLTLGRPCAVKVLREDAGDRFPAAADAFLAEARAASALVHPHIVTVHTIGTDRDRHFIEMEFVDGCSLAAYVDPGHPLEPIEATRYMVQIASALGFAHERGVVHRDVKPGNVMVSGARSAKLADFGLAKHVTSEAPPAMKGKLCGTPPYMAPELFRGRRATPQSDVYAMGITYYALLTGRLPAETTLASESMRSAAGGERPDLAPILERLEPAAAAVITRCLEERPERRFPDASALHEALRIAYGSMRSLRSLVEEAMAGDRVTITGRDDLIVRVDLDDGRAQTVHVTIHGPGRPREQLVRIYSVCAPVSAAYFRRALELNTQIHHGAIGIDDVEGVPHFVMVDVYPRATCDPEEMRESVMTIARHADDVERVLTGADRH